jgi:hypothetical protein
MRDDEACGHLGKVSWELIKFGCWLVGRRADYEFVAGGTDAKNILKDIGQELARAGGRLHPSYRGDLERLYRLDNNILAGDKISNSGIKE